MKETLKSKKGITLIALIITIIVLIILAGISIAVLTGEDGLITKAKQGAQNYQNAAIEEQQALNSIYTQADTQLTTGSTNNSGTPANQNAATPQSQQQPATTGGGFTDSDREMLTAVYQKSVGTYVTDFLPPQVTYSYSGSATGSGTSNSNHNRQGSVSASYSGSVTIPTLHVYTRISDSTGVKAYGDDGNEIAITNNDISDALYITVNNSASLSGTGSIVQSGSSSVSKSYSYSVTLYKV